MEKPRAFTPRREELVRKSFKGGHEVLLLHMAMPEIAILDFTCAEFIVDYLWVGPHNLPYLPLESMWGLYIRVQVPGVSLCLGRATPLLVLL